MWFVIIVIIVLFIAIVFCAYKLKKWFDEQEAYEQRRKEEAKKKAEREAQQKKRKAIYKKHLPNIYGGLSRKKLEQIYPLLKTMKRYESVSTPDSPGFSTEYLDIYCDAEEKLLKLLNNPYWNVDNKRWKKPLWVSIDFEYVHNLLYPPEAIK